MIAASAPVFSPWAETVLLQSPLFHLGFRSKLKAQSRFRSLPDAHGAKHDSPLRLMEADDGSDGTWGPVEPPGFASLFFGVILESCGRFDYTDRDEFGRMPGQGCVATGCVYAPPLVRGDCSCNAACPVVLVQPTPLSLQQQKMHPGALCKRVVTAWRTEW